MPGKIAMFDARQVTESSSNEKFDDFFESYWQTREMMKRDGRQRHREGDVEWLKSCSLLLVRASHHLLDEFFVFDIAIEILLRACVFQDLINICVG